MTEHFYFRNHLCIAMELLSINLYELIKANGFVGFTTALIRRFTSQMLMSLTLMRHHRIVHCDLKPEVSTLDSWLSRWLLTLHRMCYYVTRQKAPSKSSISAVAVSSTKKVRPQNHPWLLCDLLGNHSIHVHPKSVLPIARGHPGYELPHGH